MAVSPVWAPGHRGGLASLDFRLSFLGSGSWPRHSVFPSAECLWKRLSPRFCGLAHHLRLFWDLLLPLFGWSPPQPGVRLPPGSQPLLSTCQRPGLTVASWRPPLRLSPPEKFNSFTASTVSPLCFLRNVIKHSCLVEFGSIFTCYKFASALGLRVGNKF